MSLNSIFEENIIMNIKQEKTKTTLNISKEVVLTIASEVIREIDGVYSLANIPVKNTLFSPNTITRPIKISFYADVVHVDIGIIVNMNYKIREVAEQVQENIKKTVQDMTGIAVAKVNVNVLGVNCSNN